NGGPGRLEVFVEQKNRERAAIKERASDQNETPRRSLGADCNILHLCFVDATRADRGFRLAGSPLILFLAGVSRGERADGIGQVRFSRSADRRCASTLPFP